MTYPMTFGTTTTSTSAFYKADMVSAGDRIAADPHTAQALLADYAVLDDDTATYLADRFGANTVIAALLERANRAMTLIATAQDDLDHVLGAIAHLTDGDR
jgi:hypothetical protein